ncbi:AtpZ/AtpI family protein [Winogradskyella schleiferi]|uniref:AtpZ/AtpI family protein n=1 Tax=Winogradskyella schleiferi TaxID=2686078 RepID=UPI0015BBE783|nr:AtpZ/AtpI family protein [Winogradskyella schleiferi]
MSQANHNKPQSQQPQDQKDKLNSYAVYSGIVIQMVAIIAIGTFIGIKLDESYPNENNLFTLGLTLGSVIASIIYVIRRIIAASKDDNK